jgi:hypothetical protein
MHSQRLAEITAEEECYSSIGSIAGFKEHLEMGGLPWGPARGEPSPTSRRPDHRRMTSMNVPHHLG